MKNTWLKRGLVALGLLAIWTTLALAAAPPSKPAIVLTAFGTSTEAADTYKFFEKKVRERFPGYEIHWAYTSKIIRQKLKEERQIVLKDLSQVLRELKEAGVSKAAIQSLHIVPGEEWEKKVVAASRQVPGLKVALGEPLLSSRKDRERLVKALAKMFPRDLGKTAVVVVGHGSPSPRGEKEYVALEELLRSRYGNVFLGVVEGKPSAQEALEKVKRSGVSEVLFVPLFFVAGDHMQNDIMGDNPESWKSQLLAQKPYVIQAVPKGLGYHEDIAAIYLDHLSKALMTLEAKR